MGHYYFVVPSLPPLSLLDLPEITFSELMVRLETCLSRKDLEKVKTLRLFIDICNIRSLLMEEPVDPRGNLGEKELDESLLIQTALPDYVFEFLGQFEKVSDKIRNFPGLLALFFNREIENQEGFLKSYFQFEREWRLVLAALRAKQLGRDIAKELQFEEPTEPLVAQILAQKDSDRYDPPMEYNDLKELVSTSYADPWLQQAAFVEYRFHKIADMTHAAAFSIDQILSYVAQLMLVEDKNALDAERGKMILDTFKSG